MPKVAFLALFSLVELLLAQREVLAQVVNKQINKIYADWQKI
jgi:hypothetical protein